NKWAGWAAFSTAPFGRFRKRFMKQKTSRCSAAATRLWVVVVALLVSQWSVAERIKDIASVAGVRSNQLVGYGLVVGLDGSGDQTNQAPFTVQTFTTMLEQFGISVPEGLRFQLKNVAAVAIH